MQTNIAGSHCLVVCVSVVVLALAAAGCAQLTRACRCERVRVDQVDFRGWRDSWRISNGACELVVVPSINRVMSFSLAGGANLLWVSKDANGQVFAQDDGRWHNLGGDKVWPTSQDLWKACTGRNGWPPPFAFDSAPACAAPIPGGVRLTSAVDANFDAVCVREFVMDPSNAVVNIRQWYDKRMGKPMPMTFWSITQVRRPDISLLPPGSAVNGPGYRKLGDLQPECLSAQVSALALRGSETVCQKIGVTTNTACDNGWVGALWQGEGTLFVQSHRLVRDGAYPDGGCQAEIYAANRENGSYAEMELLSPLQTLPAGERLRHDVVWQLVRLPADVAADAARVGAMAEQAHRNVIGP